MSDLPKRLPWPFPGDNKTIRARKVALMAIAQLRALAPEAAAQVVGVAAQFGEDWVHDQLEVHDDHDVLTPGEAARYLCVSVATLAGHRRSGRLEGIRTPQGWRYRVTELRRLQEGRPRRSAVADG